MTDVATSPTGLGYFMYSLQALLSGLGMPAPFGRLAQHRLLWLYHAAIGQRTFINLFVDSRYRQYMNANYIAKCEIYIYDWNGCTYDMFEFRVLFDNTQDMKGII